MAHTYRNVDRDECRFSDGSFKHKKQHSNHPKKFCKQERRQRNSDTQFIMNFVRHQITVRAHFRLKGSEHYRAIQLAYTTHNLFIK